MPARRFGNVRKLPSGRYQARWEDTDGTEHKATSTFAEAAEARRWLSAQETDRHRGDWVDPDKGRTTLRTYADEWLDGKPDEDVGPRTRDLYRSLLKHHVLPTLGSKSLSTIDTAAVKAWRAKLLRSGVGAVTVAKSYRLLRAILNGAIEDGRIGKNPCTIKGAGEEKTTAERKPATVGQVHAIADAIEPRFRALVLLAAFSGLRFGELGALTRQRIDLEAATVTVAESALELADGSRVIGDPKTEQSVRTVALPAHLVSVLTDHLEQYVGPEKGALVFTGPKGAPIRRGNFHKVWAKARDGAAMPESFHFHDLRHTGNTLAAATGASTAQLMARMGHASPRAAMIYQHATDEGDRAIAAALDAMIATAGR
jgi:integrase